jgi:23S rRNA G2445 N2-methylase RlmL
MDLYTQKQKIIVTANRRQSEFVANEIIALGLSPTEVFGTGVALEGTMQDCIRLNLSLRCAGQVLISLKEFVCNNANDLYKEVLTIDWTEYLEQDAFFSITSVVFNETIDNNLFANVRVKDAIVDQFREQYDTRPNTGPEKDKAVIHLHWKDDHAEIFLDTSGETLAKHNYRFLPGKAPMIEALASCTIAAGKWDRTSHFINPMCGSGTLAIEAALLATNRVPGLLRYNYGFMHYKNYDAKIYQAELELIRNKVTTMPENMKIVASDISRRAIDVSQRNAESAGVAELITFEICDFKETTVPQNESGVIYINPEYGERLGEEEELEIVYKEMGDFFKQTCKGYFAYIFTGNAYLAKKVGLKTNRKIEFFNGKIDCRLLEFELYGGTRKFIASAEKLD